MEILAPVGAQAQLTAAVRAGADAVYLGAQSFNARRNAQNFDGPGLRGAISYCHARGVKVHVTVNTLVTDGQERELIALAEEIAQAGADAVIVQDLAVARVFQTLFPTLALHASTQMSVHSADGVGQLEQMGFSRVVLARELSAREIAQIRSRTNIELESFVHGALCVSVSGQCYLSCMLGGRSGNRGLCAQPCRLNFAVHSANGQRDYALSLRDLSLVDQLRALEDLGVCSAKIEGRMKRPEYVAAAVHACRQALAGEPPDMEQLRAVFSRDGFTDGYFAQKRDVSMFGRRTEHSAAQSRQVYGQIAQWYRAEFPRVPVQMTLSAQKDQPLSLTVSDGKTRVTVRGEPPAPAQNRPLSRESLQKALSKTGGTPFFLQTLQTRLDEGLFVPEGQVSAMRRLALEELLKERGAIRPHPRAGLSLPPLPPKRERTGSPEWHISVRDVAQLTDKLCSAPKIHLPVEKITRREIDRLGDRLIGELPVLTFPGEEEALYQRVLALRRDGLMALCGHNIAAVRLANRAGLALWGGYGLNISNSRALQAYQAMGLAACTLSMEISARQARDIRADIPVGMMAYGHLPLMQLRACPARGKGGCAACRGDAFLTDRTGRHFPLLCHSRRYSTLLNPDVLYLADCPPTGVDYLILSFTVEPAQTCEAVYQAYRTGAPPAPGSSFTRGMTHKTLL